MRVQEESGEAGYNYYCWSRARMPAITLCWSCQKCHGSCCKHNRWRQEQIISPVFLSQNPASITPVGNLYPKIHWDLLKHLLSICCRCSSTSVTAVSNYLIVLPISIFTTPSLPCANPLCHFWPHSSLHGGIDGRLSGMESPKVAVSPTQWWEEVVKVPCRLVGQGKLPISLQHQTSPRQFSAVTRRDGITQRSAVIKGWGGSLETVKVKAGSQRWSFMFLAQSRWVFLTAQVAGWLCLL